MSKEDFDAIDNDGDGFITTNELLMSMSGNPNVSAEDMATVVTMADEDGDSQISYEEYAKFLP